MATYIAIDKHEDIEKNGTIETTRSAPSLRSLIRMFMFLGEFIDLQKKLTLVSTLI